MKNILLIFFFIVVIPTIILAQTIKAVSVVLKNSKVVVGNLIEENPNYIIVKNDLGDIKLSWETVESITFNPFIKMENSYSGSDTKIKNDSIPDGYKFVLNDRVVVHLNNGNVVSGLLLAKSLDMIMIQTEVGNLTIPKKDLQLLEYVSTEYAERGEIVIVNLTNGSSIEGNIYFEDSDNLAIDTKIGRLTLNKENLRSIVYTGKVGYSETSLIDQYSNVAAGKTKVQPRLDVISLGVSPGYGDEYQPGYEIKFANRFLLSESKGFYLSGMGMLGLYYFPLNQDNYTDSPIAVTASGGAFITSIGGGVSISVYPQESSFFEFYITPFIEADLIYQKLELTYPSFPSQNSSQSETSFYFGAGAIIGIDFLLTDWRLGLSYDLHYVFGQDDFNCLSLNFVKEIF